MAWNSISYAPPYSNTYLPQQMPPQAPAGFHSPQPGISLASRMVSNRDEANAAPADFSGAMMVFPDIRNNRIYVKQWNIQTGAADFFEFVPYAPEVEKPTPPVQYATVEQLNAVLAELDALKRTAGKETLHELHE